jgi:sulfide dehydrogenase cytochrome subunit
MRTDAGTLLRLLVIVLLCSSVVGVAVAADPDTVIGLCEDCHGAGGASQDPEIPTIGGFSSAYLIASLKQYRDNARPCETSEYPAGPRKGETTDMCRFMEALSDQQIETISEYFSAKPFVRAKQKFKDKLAKRGKRLHEYYCHKCHEDGGGSPDDEAGILAGQWMPYLRQQFEHFVSGKRRMPEKMAPEMDKQDEEDIEALIHYYASFQ